MKSYRISPRERLSAFLPPKPVSAVRKYGDVTISTILHLFISPFAGRLKSSGPKKSETDYFN